MRCLKRRWTALVVAGLVAGAVTASDDDGWTYKHEKGRCAMRGHCGKQGFFGSALPCPDNGIAEEPNSTVRSKLVDLCGDKWADGPVCCTEEQIDTLSSNLKTANKLVSTCPACKENFFNLFCTFSCSPDQSLFVNITKTEPKDDKLLVTEVDNLWAGNYGVGFYDSCKDVKFGATNSRAIDFIGGGAKNYTQLLKFLGDKKALGSPFQINFPRPDSADFKGMKPQNPKFYPCNSTDEAYRCSCVDCVSSCPELGEVEEIKQCYVGAWPCVSFAVVLIYGIFLMLLITAITGHVAYRKHAENRNERLRLLQDTAMSDDEDEDGEIVYEPAVLSKAPRRYALNTACDRIFSSLGFTCAKFPAITITISLIVFALLSLGWLNFVVETDPVRLWVAPNSDAAEQKAYFDKNFGPFFRAEQAFLVNDTDPSGPGPVLSEGTLRWWFDVEDQVRRIKSEKEGVTFDEVCYNPTGDGCVVQSLTGYWPDRKFENVDPKKWKSQLEHCTDSPSECLPDFGLPLQTKMVLGGWNGTVLNAEALVVTWVVKNHAEGSRELATAMDWEEALKLLLQSVQYDAVERGLRLSFNTEISLQQELNKSTNTDAKIVVISYIIMFLYASLALGSTALAMSNITRRPASALVDSKFMLGVAGIIIVLMSVIASVGFFSAVGIRVTLIIAEVIPFLVLAVGVDNIFLIVHEFGKCNDSHPDEPVEYRIGKALGRMGPSILLSATMETVAFALGAFVGMPAVRNFAAYAAGAVFINAILQVTMFISVLALDQRRVEDGRMDCVPCLRVRYPGSLNSVMYGTRREDALQDFIRRTYAPAILGKKAKTSIITLFLGLFTAGLALLPEVKLGLDQRVALPSDSYLIDYFNDLAQYFETGPPVYFVTRDLNVTQRAHQRQICGRFTTCNQYSLPTILEQERQRPEISYIADPAASWLDDYFTWLNPSLEECCVDSLRQPCFADRDPPWNVTLSGMPTGAEFVTYMERWLAAPTTAECPKAGKAAYSDAIVYDAKTLMTPATHFRTSHTALKTQADYIAALAAARRITADISSQNDGIEVFPYSKFYIFFDMYASIVSLTFALLASAIATCFLISSILLGSARTGAVVAATVTMTLVDIGGAMAITNVDLNAVSLVNLVICVGIAVEFCAHIARAFQFPSPRLVDRSGVARVARFNVKPSFNGLSSSTGGAALATAVFRGRDARAWAALTHVGASVFSGITITKLLGVTVLAFTSSKIFEIYYFRVWLALVILAAVHALVFLPVALSFFGGDGYLDPEGEGGLEEDLASRRGRGRPLLAEADDDDSEDDY